MKFSELVDINELRGLCESFTALTGAASAILDLEGRILVATGWQDICTRFHRVHPETACLCRESDTVLAGQLEKGERYNVYKCKNGLVDVAVPITIGGEHVANFFTGQFFFETPDQEFFIRQAEQFGFDKNAYLDALNRVPLFSEKQVKTMMEFLSHLVRTIGEMGLSRKVLIKANEELDTYRRQLEQLVKERTAALQEANTELSQYAYIVSHDLRAPLRAIRNYVDFLREDLGETLAGDQKAYLEGLGRAVSEAEALVDDVLVLSRVSRRDIHYETVDMGSFLKKLLASLDLPANVRTVAADDWPTVEAEATLLRQIFQNLIDNAIKFNTSAEKIVELGWNMAGDDEYEFFVRDNGIGIEPRYQEQIFRVFERLHTREEYEGTGAGLAIVKKAAARLHGTVRVESETGKGSTFYVRIPKKQQINTAASGKNSGKEQAI